jgi:hypothetical protein
MSDPRGASTTRKAAARTVLGALTWLLLAGVMQIQSAHAELQRQPTLGFSVALGGPDTPPPVGSPAEEQLEQRLRERLYSSGSEEWREERVREERRQLGHCHRIANPMDREQCFEDIR